MMHISSQRLNYKISPLDHKYSRRVEQDMAGSHSTFSDVETPGWSSLMKSDISDHTKRTDKQPPQTAHMLIYNKLNSAAKLAWDDKAEQKMLKVKPQIDKNQTRDSENAKHASLAKKHAESVKKPPKPKRWNQITVHEHLYQDSIKQQNKRMAQQILDEQFKRKQIYRFAPEISKKSIMLAESKFSRVKRDDYAKQQENTLQTQATEVKQKQDKDVQRYRLLNRLFYFLSQNQTLLVQSSLESTLQKLPMPCITTLQPIITKIYRGAQMDWLDFLEQFNDKTIKNKQAFFALMHKWFQRAGRNALTDRQPGSIRQE